MKEWNDHSYDFGPLRGGQFPHDWGIAALHAHAADPKVTNDGKGRALAEIERRANNRERDRSWI